VADSDASDDNNSISTKGNHFQPPAANDDNRSVSGTPLTSEEIRKKNAKNALRQKLLGRYKVDKEEEFNTQMQIMEHIKRGAKEDVAIIEEYSKEMKGW
jgi:hypothetical protein